MRTATYKQAQQSYDRMEHPDYWDDREEEAERIAEEAEDREEVVSRMFDICRGPHLARFDREERNRVAADNRRKEIRENQLMNGRGM